MAEDISKILNKYRKKLGEHIDEDTEGQVIHDDNFSRQYLQFRQEALSEKETAYEKLCNASEKILKFSPSQKERVELEGAIDTAHMNITPDGAASFAAIISFLLILFGFLFAALQFALTGSIGSVFPPLLLLVLGLISSLVLKKIPLYLSVQWRLKASNQMVLCILYIVIYMRHTSNLENAIKFTADHIQPPLSLDLRKIFWDIETRKYSTIKESLDNYLLTWRKTNLEFVTAFHLIEASLYESTEGRRQELLDKAIDTILNGTYDKMMHYAQNLKAPITTLYMLGVILPVLGLVVIPLVGALLDGLFQWYHIAFIYNLVLPIILFVVGYNALLKRPTGYGASGFAEKVLKPKFDPTILVIFIFLFFAVIGFSPLIISFLEPESVVETGAFGELFNFIEFNNALLGPFGLGALILSFAIPFGLALALSFYFSSRSRKIIKIRDETRRLEAELSSALFQLGNSIGDGIPAEVAFSKVADTLSGTPTGNFFAIIDSNIRKLGFSVRKAIFDPKMGAILSYPSPLTESSMEVLIESSRKGPKIVSQSLITISQYLESIHRVNERLKDLLAEIVSSMKSQIAFLTPAIAGIVVGVSSMIVAIIINLQQKMAQLQAEVGSEGITSGVQTLTQLFSIQGIIPTYYFQIVVGVFLIELTLILTIIQNGIENGDDKIMEQHLLGKNLFRSALIYILIAGIVSVIFTLLSGSIMQVGI